MFSASGFKESGHQPRRGVHDVCHQIPLWRVCPPHQRSWHHTHLHHRPGPGQGQGRHLLPEVQQLEKHQQVYSECRKSSFIIAVWCHYFIFYSDFIFPPTCFGIVLFTVLKTSSWCLYLFRNKSAKCFCKPHHVRHSSDVGYLRAPS